VDLGDLRAPTQGISVDDSTSLRSDWTNLKLTSSPRIADISHYRVFDVTPTLTLGIFLDNKHEYM
jgi:hypothetical protein